MRYVWIGTHFTDENKNSERLSHTSKILQLKEAELRLQTKTVWFQNLDCFSNGVDGYLS